MGRHNARLRSLVAQDPIHRYVHVPLSFDEDLASRELLPVCELTNLLDFLGILWVFACLVRLHLKLQLSKINWTNQTTQEPLRSFSITCASTCLFLNMTRSSWRQLVAPKSRKVCDGSSELRYFLKVCAPHLLRLSDWLDVLRNVHVFMSSWCLSNRFSFALNM